MLMTPTQFDAAQLRDAIKVGSSSYFPSRCFSFGLVVQTTLCDSLHNRQIRVKKSEV